MRTTLAELLSYFGVPVRLQGTYASSADYPEAFFTIWNNSSNDWHHYDNTNTGVVWAFTVQFYATDPSLVLTRTAAAIARLKSAGWIVDGMGYDIAADDPGYTGRAFDAVYLEQI